MGTLIERLSLRNGLRVLLAPDRRAGRVAVCVHYRVGFRSELPHEEGLAHLFEHLMFRGSENLPGGAYFSELAARGGEAGGTTHQDYTEYHQVVGEAQLERALFAEADRMRAPRLEPAALEAQLDGVEAEIRHKLVDDPYGGFPWPLLASVMYREFANAHDGYGDIGRLRQLTPDDCAAFFERHYSPSGAVLSIAGDFDADRALSHVERHFSGIEARPVPPLPSLDEPEPDADVLETRKRPNVPMAAVALGYRLPDPGQALDDYLAHMLLARLLDGSHVPGAPMRLSSSCGFFAPLDARSPDTLVVTSLLPGGAAPPVLVEAVDGLLERLADPASGSERADREALLAAHERRREDVSPLRRALVIGRMELLFGRVGLADEVPDRIAALDPDSLAAAADRLGRSSKALLLLERGAGARPGWQPRPPVVAAVDPATGRQGAGSRSAMRSAALPEVTPTVPSAAPEWHEQTLDSGVRTIAVADARLGLVELRLRVPLGITAWEIPNGAERLAGSLGGAVGADERAARLGGALRASTDGQWLQLGGFAPADRAWDWLGLLGDMLAALPDGGLGPSPPAPPPEPGRLADDMLRRHLIEARRGDDQACGEAQSPWPAPQGASLVAVGDLDPSCLAESAGPVLAAWQARVGQPCRVALSPAEPVELRAPSRDGGEYVVISRPELVDGSDSGRDLETARYLATAVFGGYPQSRLLAQTAGRGIGGYWASCGRDLLGHGRRAFVRGSAADSMLGALLEDIARATEDLRERPPDEAEIETAKTYCQAQLRSVLDSPSNIADVLSALVAGGRDAGWLVEAVTSGIPDIDAGAVADAAVELYAGGAPTSVVVGADPGAAGHGG